MALVPAQNSLVYFLSLECVLQLEASIQVMVLPEVGAAVVVADISPPVVVSGTVWTRVAE